MKKNIVIGAVVLAGAAVVASPYFIGMGVESKINQKIALINAKLTGAVNPDGVIKVESYQRGWFSSTAKTVIKDKTVINHEITHGPFSYFGLAKINSIIEMPETERKQLEDFFDGQKPYTITTEIAFSGASDFNFSSPALKDTKPIPTDANTLITWKGFNLTNKTTGDHSVTTIDMPLLVVNVENNTEVTIEGVSFKRDGYRQFDKQLNFVIPEHANAEAVFGINKIAVKVNETAGGESGTFLVSDIKASGNLKDNRYNADFNIANINADFDTVKFSVANINSNAKGEDGLVFLRKNLADSNWSLQAIADINKINLAVDEQAFKVMLDYHQEQKITDNSVTFNYGELYRASNINVSIPNYTTNIINSAQFDYQLDGLPKKEAAAVAENYISMIKTIVKSLLLDGEIEDSFGLSNAFGMHLQQFAVATLQTTPSFSSNLSLAGEKGTASVNLQAKLKTTDSLTNMSLLFKKLAARAESVLSVQITEALLDDVLQLVATETEQSADEMKAQLLSKIPFVVKDGELKLDIEYKDSEFYMNAQRVGSIDKMSKLIMGI